MLETQRKKLRGEVEITPEIWAQAKNKIGNILDYKKEIENFLTRKTSEQTEIILAGAFYLESSDIHFEPKEEEIRIRIRIDGVLHDILIIEPKIYKALLSRIKLLAGLKLNVTTRPQDGRFSIFVESNSIEIRASSLPSEYGETIVLRLLNPKWVVSMEQLGLRNDMQEVFNKEIQRPNGMIICTGPTGCGKTTTLYAFLLKISNPEIKVITIEDPIEYHLEGISQTQVDEARGYDFANGLRAIVRQDPDVIFIGEIRDIETAQIALQASLTGHLVLSTVHTNDAAGTIARLQALGEKPANIAPAINVAIGQRLVRRVCQKCVEFKSASPEELGKLKISLKNLPKKIKIPELKPGIKIPAAKGCESCSFLGYKGRLGLFEAFLVDDDMEKFITGSPSVAEMRERAIKKGMVLMQQDGLIKVLKGITTIEEVERATGETEEIYSP